MDANGMSPVRQFLCHYCDLPLVESCRRLPIPQTEDTSPPSHHRTTHEHLGVTQRHINRLIAEKRVPYLKVAPIHQVRPGRDRGLAGQRPSASKPVSSLAEGTSRGAMSR